jgi:hypothetical protein
LGTPRFFTRIFLLPKLLFFCLSGHLRDFFI